MMYVDTIKLVNFKGVVEKELRFNKRFTVLIGDNGTGKSSILDAVSICLGTILSRTNSSFGINGKKSRSLLKEEVRKVMISPDNIEYTDVVLSGCINYDGESLEWQRQQKKSDKSLKYAGAKKLSELGSKFLTQIDTDIDLPVIVYHSTARLAFELYGKKTQYEKIGSRLDGYYACLDPRIIKQRFMSWFKTFEDSALKFNKDKTLYLAFVDAISSMVPEWKDIKFHWGLDDMVGQLEDGTWMPLSNLSDGYRSVVRLAADIAYRAIKLNPHLGDKVVTHAKGVVLIDEIDMHLHPNWQKGIVQSLKRTFPMIQFIATTHSPFIVQSLDADEVINLDGNVIDEHPKTMTLEENARFMGVNGERSNVFLEKEVLAERYLSALKSNGKDTELQSIENLIQKTGDPVFLAKLKLEKLANSGK